MRKIPALFILLGAMISCSGGSGENRGKPHGEPVFANVPVSWRNTPDSIDMTGYWNAAGIPFGGTNHYLLPEAAAGNSHSERFNPDSIHFQAWVGVYTVYDNGESVYGIDSGGIDPDKIIKLGIVDQTQWLKDFAGIPSPAVSLDSSVPVTCEAATIDGCAGWKLTCRLNTQADVGDDNLQNGFADYLIIPKSCWQNAIHSYQQITMDICLYVWHSDAYDELNVIYYNSVRFQDLDGDTVDTKGAIFAELDSIARQITVR